jgi:RNA polymerase sigma-70 factor (ECF subfamily)
MCSNRQYSKLLRYAQQVTRRADEAEDLLQYVLLAAVEAGRADMACADNRRWLFGALRKRALFDARSAIRRRRRESSVAVADNSSSERESLPAHFISSLSPSLRTTALLALSGHTKAEIAWLLRLSDCALRQRIMGIKRRWRAYDGHGIPEIPGLNGSLLFGKIRRALHKPVRHSGALLASHDPDGNLFILCSQNRGVRQQVNSSSGKKE